MGLLVLSYLSSQLALLDQSDLLSWRHTANVLCYYMTLRRAAPASQHPCVTWWPCLSMPDDLTQHSLRFKLDSSLFYSCPSLLLASTARAALGTVSLAVLRSSILRAFIS